LTYYFFDPAAVESEFPGKNQAAKLQFVFFDTKSGPEKSTSKVHQKHAKSTPKVHQKYLKATMKAPHENF